MLMVSNKMIWSFPVLVFFRCCPGKGPLSSCYHCQPLV